MTVMVYRDGKVVEKGSVPRAPLLRSDLPCPYFISDTTEPLRSMADGKIYTSRAAMRQTYKAGGNPQGVEYQEVGDDKAYVQGIQQNIPKPDRKAIKEAVERGKADVSAGKFDHIK